MMTLLVMAPGDMSSFAAILLVVSPGLIGVTDGFVGVEREATILLVLGPRLTCAWLSKEVEGFDVLGV
jgi:hypothetical protein